MDDKIEKWLSYISMTPNSLALRAMPAKVVNILQGMSATKDVDSGYPLIAIYFDTDSLRYTIKTHRNQSCILWVWQWGRYKFRGSRTLALPLLVSWSKNIIGSTARWNQCQQAEDLLYELANRSMYLTVTVHSHCASQSFSWTVFWLEHSGTRTHLCSLLRTSYHTLREVRCLSSISWNEYRRKWQSSRKNWTNITSSQSPLSETHEICPNQCH